MKKFALGMVLSASLLGVVQAQDWAKPRLEKSPRHNEWIKVKQGDREVSCYIVFPEVKDKAVAVMVIHEIFGLTDWVRGVTDQLAEAGYVAIAPDLLSGKTFTGADEGRKAISELPPAQVLADLTAVADYVKDLPASNGKVAVTGFCWGGARAFSFANHYPKVVASFPFYGTGPQEASEVEKISCPIYGFFAENDARINQSLPKSEELLKAAGKTYEFKIYPGAGHGFMRAGEAPDASEANKKARDEAWERWKALLKKL
jgi:carboxymethylenebutenolidase